MSGDVWAYIGGLREDLGRAEERIRDLEDRCAALERQAPAAWQAQYEADLAAADLAASGLDYGNLSRECHDSWHDRCPPGVACDCECHVDAEPEGSRLAERNAYIGTWSNQDVTKREEL